MRAPSRKPGKATPGSARESGYRSYENRKNERQKAQQEQAEAARNLAASAVTNSVAEGLKWYREATDIDPDNMAGWVGLGDAAVAAGTLKEASRDLGGNSSPIQRHPHPLSVIARSHRAS